MACGSPLSCRCGDGRDGPAPVDRLSPEPLKTLVDSGHLHDSHRPCQPLYSRMYADCWSVCGRVGTAVHRSCPENTCHGTGKKYSAPSLPGPPSATSETNPVPLGYAAESRHRVACPCWAKRQGVGQPAMCRASGAAFCLTGPLLRRPTLAASASSVPSQRCVDKAPGGAGVLPAGHAVSRQGRRYSMRPRDRWSPASAIRRSHGPAGGPHPIQRCRLEVRLSRGPSGRLPRPVRSPSGEEGPAARRRPPFEPRPGRLAGGRSAARRVPR
jgi:hypothetical protein